jgi:hypothetical protein
MNRTLDLDTLTLTSGGHDPDDGAMCTMEAVAYIAGEPWSDHPQCASPVIGAFLRTWNDDSGDEQRQELKRYIPRLVNSRGTDAQESERSWMALDWLVRVNTPTWLRLAGLTVQADILASLKPLDVDNCPSILPALEAVRSDAAAAEDAVWVAAWASARAAARDAAWAAVWVAAEDAVWVAAWVAAGATRDAVWAAVWVAVWDAAWASARAAVGDAVWASTGAALAPTVTELRVSAHDLVDRMLAVTEAERLRT